MKDSKTDLQRRSFLKQGVVAGAAAAAIPAVSIAAEPVGVSKEKQQVQEGYRLTPHIRKYHETIDSQRLGRIQR